MFSVFYDSIPKNNVLNEIKTVQMFMKSYPIPQTDQNVKEQEGQKMRGNRGTGR